MASRSAASPGIGPALIRTVPGHVDRYVGYPGQLADLGPDGVRAVVTAHAGDRNGAHFHAAILGRGSALTAYTA